MTLCILCGQPLPPRRWWQLLTPPPFHDPSKNPDCQRLLYEWLVGKNERT